MADENPPNATLYVQNLNEKVKIPELCDSLRDVFGDFGNIIDVVAKKSLRRRGQAFIVFESAGEAQEAMETLSGFELHDKPMTIHFAKTRSDATVKREDDEAAYEAHVNHRKAEKERKQALEAEKASKRTAPETLADRPAKSTKAGASSIVDDYLPPNKILLIRDFPSEYGSTELTSLFQRYDGFKEVRIAPIPGVAFVEYQDETGAIAAKEGLNGAKLGDAPGPMKVTFQRQ
ncbi:U1 small nuclear ribonucleo [Lecanosticta acicola]|uniref:U1 small nuclear ribonucleo n=1 Tax=Lecanosticta acicola TaxID=111012 RepID=A0AAI9E5W1_9PEZI|nr:U1 small nuclear ribonucleo [Lecanosticta acicola]